MQSNWATVGWTAKALMFRHMKGAEGHGFQTCRKYLSFLICLWWGVDLGLLWNNLSWETVQETNCQQNLRLPDPSFSVLNILCFTQQDNSLNCESCQPYWEICWNSQNCNTVNKIKCFRQMTHFLLSIQMLSKAHLWWDAVSKSAEQPSVQNNII